MTNQVVETGVGVLVRASDVTSVTPHTYYDKCNFRFAYTDSDSQ
jgi:hypothetical protein